MATFIKSASAKNLSGTTATATFADGAVSAANNALLAVVLFFKYSNFPHEGFVGLTVQDSLGNTLLNYRDVQYPGGPGGCQLGLFMLSPCAAGATGVVATSTDSGQIFVAVHEVQPSDVGKLLYLGGFENEFATAVQFPEPVFGLSGEYAFVAYGVDNQSYQPSIGSVPSLSGWNAREYCHNDTALDTGATTTGGVPLNLYGSLCTWDDPGDTGIPAVIYTPATDITVWTSIAFFVSLYSAVPTAKTPVISLPSGNYAGAQSVTILSHDGFPIYFTLDGSTPTTASTLYSGAIAIPHTMTIKALCHDPSGVDADSAVATSVLTLYTGQCLNPGNIIDGNDATFCDLICGGTNGDEVAVKALAMSGVTGDPGHLVVDYEITENDLVAPTQTLPAWKISGFIAGAETVLDSAAPGAGVQARTTKSLAVPAGTNAGGLVMKAFGACQIPGSSGGVHVKIYAAYLTT